MEYVIIGVIAAAALACPMLMCGPMLLRRFGIINVGDAGTSCMGTMPGGRESQDHQRGDLIARREEIDAEIARVESRLSGRAADEPPPHTSAPHSTKSA